MTDAPPSNEVSAEKIRRALSRRRKRTLPMVGVPIAGLCAGGVVYLRGGRYVETDNAYVKADKVPVSAEVSGPIHEVLVKENDVVVAGQPLFRIDPAQFCVAIARAEARVAQVRTDLAAMKATYREKQAEITLARTRQAFIQGDQRRQAELMSEKLISASTFDGARLNTALARDQIAALEQDLIRIAETLGGTLDAPIERHPTYRAAMAELDQAKLDLARIEVRASLAGTVTKPPKIGQHVEAGLIVMALVVSGNLWIEANWRSRQSRGPFERIYMPPSTESGGAWMFRSSADPVGGRHDNERSADRSKCSFQEGSAGRIGWCWSTS